MKKNVVLTAALFAVIALAFSIVACGGDDESPPPTATVIAVTVDTDSEACSRGGAIRFTATVAGTNNPAQTVTWSIESSGKHAKTTISNAGYLEVSEAETLNSITVKAVSTVDTTKSGTKIIAITGWTAVTDSTFGTGNSAGPIYAIAYGGSKFVAMGSSGKTATSSDGVTWKDVTDSSLTGTNVIAYGNDKFVAGSGGTIKYRTNF